jgi:glycosyltransferase involved in cell wall biosynthesis
LLPASRTSLSSGCRNMRAKRIYRAIRPFLKRLGTLGLAGQIASKELRQPVATRIGLEGFPSPLSTVRMDPFRGPVRADGVNFVTDMRANTGQGESARMIFHALDKAGLSVNYQEVVTSAVNRDHPLPDHAGAARTLYGVTLIHLVPSEARVGIEAFPGSFTASYNIGFWMLDLPRLPESWFSSVPVLDEVWTPSTYSQSIIAQFTHVPVVYMPLPIKVSLSGRTRADFGLPENRFLFCFVFNPTSSVARKNPFGVLEAFRRAFAGEANPPLLVMKAAHLSAPLNAKIAPKLREAMQSIGGVLIEADFTREQMNDLLAACDCFVSLHRAEGWGRTIAESMALGKPVIATAYSANTDFMTPANSFEVGYTLRPITEKDHADQPFLSNQYESGQLWAEPDLDHAAELMRYVVANPEVARARGQLARQEIESGWCVEAVSERIIERFNRLGERHR